MALTLASLRGVSDGTGSFSVSALPLRTALPSFWA